MKDSRTVCERCGREFIPQSFEFEAGGKSWTFAVATVCEACAELEEQDALDAEDRRRFEKSAANDKRPGDRGSRLAKASFALFEKGEHNARALEVATEWIRTPSIGENLLIVGPVGSGKSYLAACCFNALHEALRPAYWLNAGSLMAKIRRGFIDRDAAMEAGEQMDLAETVPHLVLDDLGKVHPGKDVSWVEETFYSIVEARYRDELPTIVTTEWRSEALAERVGESVVSRLVHGAYVASIRAPENAYRVQGGK